MRSEREIREALRSWVLSKARDLDSSTLTDKTPLFEERQLRSLHLPELLLFLEQLRGEPIDVDDLRPGDLLGVAATGAYCYSLSSRYNMIGRPAVVAVRAGRSRLILRRETVDDLLTLGVR